MVVVGERRLAGWGVGWGVGLGVLGWAGLWGWGGGGWGWGCGGGDGLWGVVLELEAQI